VLQLSRVQKQDGIVLALVFLEPFVGSDKIFLLLRGGRVARQQLGLFIAVTEAMQQHGHAAVGVMHAEALLDPAGYRCGFRTQRLLEVHVKLGHVRGCGSASLPT